MINDELQALVDKQAEDEGLWAVPLGKPQPIAEAHLQKELRRLHAAIERRVSFHLHPAPAPLLHGTGKDWRGLSAMRIHHQNFANSGCRPKTKSIKPSL